MFHSSSGQIKEPSISRNQSSVLRKGNQSDVGESFEHKITANEKKAFFQILKQ